jgi:4,5-dihydroxyphthalate decarboxylase
MALELSFAVYDYDRTRAIFDGCAPIECCDVATVALEPEASFHRAFKFQGFDVTEISMSSYLLSLVRGEAHYVAIPPSCRGCFVFVAGNKRTLNKAL